MNKKINPDKIYKDNVEITKSNVQEWEEKLKGIEYITGDLYINAHSRLEAPTLKDVGGDLCIYAKIKKSLEERLWKYNSKNRWHLTEQCSEWLLSQQGNIQYFINDIEFDRLLFDKVRRDELTAIEVFALTNMEQRRIAYERMNKAKMKDLPQLKVLDEVKDDGYGYPMRVISFNMDGYTKPFKYLNCFCPSTGREYYIETQQDTCNKQRLLVLGSMI